MCNCYGTYKARFSPSGDQWPVGFGGPYDFVYIISNCLDV